MSQELRTHIPLHKRSAHEVLDKVAHGVPVNPLAIERALLALGDLSPFTHQALRMGALAGYVPVRQQAGW